MAAAVFPLLCTLIFFKNWARTPAGLLIKISHLLISYCAARQPDITGLLTAETGSRVRMPLVATLVIAAASTAHNLDQQRSGQVKLIIVCCREAAAFVVIVT